MSRDTHNHSPRRRIWPLALLLALAPLPPSRAGARGPVSITEKEEEHLNKGLDAPPEGLDRSTPLKSWSLFIQACRDRRYEMGVHMLNLGEIPEADRKVLGPSLARQLCEVLKVTRQLVAKNVDDTALGPMADDRPRNYAVVATVEGSEGRTEELWLRRVNDKASDQHVWVMTRKTVSMIQDWFRHLVKKERPAAEAVPVVNRVLGKIPSSFKLESPRDAASLFVQLARDGAYKEAARLLDLSAVPERQQAERGRRLARRLALVLKRVHPGGFGRMSNDPKGTPERDLPPDEEVVAHTKLGDTPVQIRLSRILRQGDSPVWVFSSATVGDIDALYQKLGYGWAGDYLPPLFFEWELASIQLWQWIGLALAMVVAMLFGYILSFLTRKILIKAASFTRWEWDDDVVCSMRGPLVLVFWVLGLAIAIPLLALAPGPCGFLLGMCKLVAIMALGWFLLRIIDVAGEQLSRLFKERRDDMGTAMVPVARKILKAVTAVIVLIVALQNVGMDVGGLLAGLGIGGLAFALAGKTTLENLFGGITIAFDRPFKVGDFIKVGDFVGTVEDVGLRSTRIRTVDRTLVTIPNGQMMDSKVENYSSRDRIRLQLTIGVQYDTSLDQMRYIVDELKRYLLAHPRIWQETWRVRFVGFGPSSLDMEIFCYLTTTDFGEFTALREQILMDLAEVVERAGAQFAYPSQTVYVGKDSPADAKKAKQASSLVAERRKAGLLSIPEIPDALKEQILGAAADRDGAGGAPEETGRER